MQQLSQVCAIIAGILMFATPIMFLIWLFLLILKKPAKNLGVKILICAGCFVAAVVIGTFSDPDIAEHFPNTEAETTAVPIETHKEEIRNYSNTVGNEAGKTYSETEPAAVPVETCKEEIRNYSNTAGDETDGSYSEVVKNFAKKNDITEGLSNSLKNAMDQSDFKIAFEELNGWEEIDDWAFGKRYRTWSYRSNEDKYYWLLVYECRGKVENLYDITDGKKLIYSTEPESSSVDQPRDDSIHLVDGVLGKYGKEVTIPSQTYGEYTYTWYMVPAGVYDVINEFKTATVFVVSNENSDDVKTTLQFSDEGETGVISIPEGTHIELSMRAEILLKPKTQ